MNLLDPKLGAQISAGGSSPVIFLGPTLPIQRARAILEAHYLPPVRRGNLDMIRTPCRIGIIDGVLEEGIRIEPDEIAAASGRGLRIFGAGSTGALLAATDKTRKIQGLGSVYRFLACYPHLRTLIEILYTEPEYETLTVPLINIALSVEKYYPHKSLNVAEQLRIIPLPERSRDNIRRVLANSGIRDFEKIMAPNYKSDDATRLLKWFSLQGEADAHSPAVSSFLNRSIGNRKNESCCGRHLSIEPDIVLLRCGAVPESPIRQSLGRANSRHIYFVT